MEDGGYGAGEEGAVEEMGGCYVWQCFVSGISLSLLSERGTYQEGRGSISNGGTALADKGRVMVVVVGRSFVFLVVWAAWAA